MSARRHLLLAITGEADVHFLVEEAHRVSLGSGASWSVVAIESTLLLQRRREEREVMLSALAQARALGAAVSRISTGSHVSSALVSALVHRAHSEGATQLMVGHGRGAATGWLPADADLSAFVVALSTSLPGVAVHLVCPPQDAMATRPTKTGLAARARRRRLAPWRAWVDVGSALAVATVLGALLEKQLHPTNVVMLYLAAVVYTASRAGQAQAVATVLGSIFLYDLIFVLPRWSLKPTEPQYWLAFLLMMAVGLLISQLAARSREQALLAEARAQRTQALNHLAAALGRARDQAAVAQALCGAVQASVGVAATLVFNAEGQPPTALAPDPWVAGFDADWARQAMTTGQEVGAGQAQGAEQALRYLPLVAGDTAFGVLVLPPPAPDQDTLEDQHLVRALVNQTALALERVTLEQRSLAAAVQAEGERTRNTLLAGLSHDFRTPLTTIVGSATALLDQADAIDEGQRRSLLQSLLLEAQRLHALTSNLLDLTRLDEGVVQPRLEWCPADELLASARAQLNTPLQNHPLQVQGSAEALVWCDPRLLEQVLVNLMDNALKYSPPGGRLRVFMHHEGRDWVLQVQDDGPGVPPGQEQAIFKKFYRAASDGDPSGKGLGLALCAAIVGLHGGTITVANSPGAVFTVRLPQPEPPCMDAELSA